MVLMEGAERCLLQMNVSMSIGDSPISCTILERVRVNATRTQHPYGTTTLVMIFTNCDKP
jgi:hypothetical protein